MLKRGTFTPKRDLPQRITVPQRLKELLTWLHVSFDPLPSLEVFHRVVFLLSVTKMLSDIFAKNMFSSLLSRTRPESHQDKDCQVSIGLMSRSRTLEKEERWRHCVPKSRK